MGAITGKSILIIYLSAIVYFGAQTTVNATAKGVVWGTQHVYHLVKKPAKPVFTPVAHAVVKVGKHLAK